MPKHRIVVALLVASLGCQREDATKPKKTITEESLDDLREYIRRDVAAGFSSEEAISRNAVEMLSDDYDETALTPHAVKITRELMAAHEREQASWPSVTDCDRLDAAFRALEGAGVVCRQDFSCCGSCGAGEIEDEMQRAATGGKKVRGYAFYHQQDTESAVEGDGLYLSYGAVEDGETAAVAVGREITAALEQQGLAVKWDGTWETRIGVGLDWKRRR